MTTETYPAQPDNGKPAQVQAEGDLYVFPASYGQRRLWFLDQFEPGSPYYNIPVAFRLAGRFDFNVFHRTIDEIVARHESLRTTFRARDGEPIQVVSPHGTIAVPQMDLGRLAAEERERELLRLVREEGRCAFDLAHGPLFRVKVIRVGGEDHVILVNMHHIISDGWSVGIVANEISTLYGAFAQGWASPLAPLSIQYADYSAWQREWLQGDVLERQIAYWKRQLDGAPDVLHLPLDRPRPNVYTNAGAAQSIQIAGDLRNALDQLCRREGATMFMLLLAAFQTLLYRYSGQDDICVGAPIANRTQAEVENIIGLFINTLVLRTDLSGDPTFSELLSRVKDMTLNAYSHQDLPFEMLVDALQVGRDMSHAPLFQVMLILQNAPAKVRELPGLRLTQLDVDLGTSTSELTLTVSESSLGIDIAAEYNTDLFNASTIQRMLDHYVNLLRRIAAHPDLRISRIPLLSLEERARIVSDWNDVRGDSPELCVHELIESAAEEASHAIAVASLDEQLTYGALNEKANRIAHYLIGLGVGPEVRVGICMEKCLEMILGVLGVLKSGGAYVPMDPSYPRERIVQMLEDSEVGIVLTTEEISPSLPEFNGMTVCLGREWHAIATESSENPRSGVCPDNLAYMIYTSGTTGKSKGTLISHRSLMNSYLGWEAAYCLKTGVRSHLQMANFAFDVFSGDLVRALCSGGKLVLCPREYLLDGERLYELMLREEVDIAEFVPAVLRNLIQYLESTGQRLDFMRLLIAGSDIWYVREYNDFRKLIGPETRLINSFGLTEAAIDSSFFEASNLDLAEERVVPIGRPFRNAQMFILDPQLEPAPIGVAGELYIGGLGLARAYHRRGDLTGERFIPNPFSTAPGERLYRTGDLARYLQDGNVEFLGRTDHQVKVRGFRVELGEIETALKAFPSVKDGVAAAREDTPGDKRLVAYVVPADRNSFGAAALKSFLLEKLPNHMVPSAIMVLEALPLTPNGKVDRASLPVPEQLERQIDEAYVAPRNPSQQILAGIWTQLLGTSRIGIHDDFFLLGGHSLLATQLVSRIRETFRVEIPLRSVFETPTIAAIAELIDRAHRETEGIGVLPMTRAARIGEIPLSFAQQRLWFLDQLEPDSPFYNLPEVYRIEGPLDVAVLQRCFNEVIRRHETLRTYIKTVDGKPSQVILPALEIDIPVEDLANVAPATRELEMMRLAAELAGQPIPLATAPLLRGQLLRLGLHEHVIVLVMHHIISDDWSTSLLIREVATLYEAFLHDRPASLPELPVQYADFAAWQRGWLQGAVLDRELGYWRTQLAGCPPALELPTDRPRPAVQTFNGSYRPLHVSKEISSRVREIGNREGTTMFMTLLAAFQMLLARYSGQDDICTGTPIANRDRAEVENLIGFFVNTLVIRTDLSGNPTFRGLLRRVRETALSAYAHQDVPFEKLVDAIQPERNLSHSPLFQVMFVLQNAVAQGHQSADLIISAVDAHSGTAKFDLTLFMVDDSEGFSGALEYNTDLFEASTIDRMLQHFESLLESICKDPDLPIASHRMLSDEELVRLTREWNGKQQDYGCTGCVHELIEAQVEKTPDAVAVEDGDRSLSYFSLNLQANQLAHYLRELGVGPDVLVGIALERSADLILAMVAILKAGGAYVPLELGYPRERLAYMLVDSGLSVVITRESLLDKIPGHAARTLCLDIDYDEVRRQSPANPHGSLLPGHLAYVIYTSGSTGRPKGVMITHGGLANYLSWCLSAYPVAEGRGSVVHSTIAFDATVTAIFPALLAGKTLRLVSEKEGVEGLAGVLRGEKGFSLLKITPAHLYMLGHLLVRDEAAGICRSMIIGGENLTCDQIAFWRTNAPGTRLFNEYGPTETVVGCIVYEVPSDACESGSVLIGRPIPNTTAYVLDHGLRPVATGIPGELYLGGVGVARGYLKQPALTAERFIPDCLGGTPGARLYRTGDRARYRPDGNLEFLGRVDDQVKIRGYRIEIGEVETILSEHPEIREAAVVAREDKSGNKRLLAYFVARSDTGPTETELRRFLSTKLPEFMMPSVFVALAGMPLTENGKVNRRALPEPEHERPALETRFAEPQTREEKILAEIWATVLGIDRVGAEDNFFELGGDSIMSIQVIARANQAGLRLIARQLFQAPTVAALAIEAQKAGIGPQAEQGTEFGSTIPAAIPGLSVTEEPGSALSEFGWNENDVRDLMAKIKPLE